MFKSLESIKKRHNHKMQVLELKAELKIKENNLKNKIKHDKLTAEKEQLSIINSIRELKNIVKQDKSLIKSGKFLEFWGTVGTIISTLLTIAGLWKYFCQSYLKAITFVLSIVMTQFTVFILAKQDTNMKVHFRQHVFKVVALKFLLITISVYGNTTFFLEGRPLNWIGLLTTLALCIAIDLISIFVISISQDMKTLNKNVAKDSIYKGLLGKALYNLTFKVVESIENKYMQNKIKVLERKRLSVSAVVPDKDSIEKLDYDKNKEIKKVESFVPDKDTENKIDYKQDLKVKKLSDFVQDKNTSKVKNDIACNNTKNIGRVTKLDFDKNVDEKLFLKVIYENKKGNVCPSIDFLMQATGFNKDKIRELKKKFSNLGILKTSKFTTFLLIDNYATALKMLNGGGVHYDEKS